MRTVRLGAALFVLVAAGCTREIPGAPEDAVRGFFDAVAAQDCQRIQLHAGGTLGARLRDQGCAATLHAFAGFVLDRVESSAVDGRDPRAWLVRVRLRGRSETVVVRVDGRAGHWAVVSL